MRQGNPQHRPSRILATQERPASADAQRVPAQGAQAMTKLRIVEWDSRPKQIEQTSATERRVQGVIDLERADSWALIDQQVIGGTGILIKFFLWFRRD
jgi:hypothetical protein